MTQAEQVLDGEATAALVVHDHRAARPGGPPVDQHEGDVPLDQLADEVIVDRREGHDEPIQPSVADEPLVHAVRGGIRDRLGLDHHDQLAGRRRGGLDAVGDIREAQVVEARDDEPEGVRAAGAQTARERVGAVAQLARRGQDALAGLRPDLLAGVVAEHPGRGRRVDVRASGDVLEVGHGLSSGAAAARRHDRVRIGPTSIAAVSRCQAMAVACSGPTQLPCQHRPARAAPVMPVASGETRNVDRGGDVAGRQDPAQWMLRSVRGQHLVAVREGRQAPLEQRRERDAGAHGVDGDALPCQVERRRPGRG